MTKTNQVQQWVMSRKRGASVLDWRTTLHDQHGHEIENVISLSREPDDSLGRPIFTIRLAVDIAEQT